MKEAGCTQEDINVKHLCGAGLHRILVFLAEDVPLIYLQTHKAMIYWSRRLAGRSKAELIRCETHGAFRQTEKKREEQRGEKRDCGQGRGRMSQIGNMSFQHVQSGCAYLIFRWEMMTRGCSPNVWEELLGPAWSSLLSFPLSVSLCLSLSGFDVQLVHFRHALSPKLYFYLLSGGIGSRWDTYSHMGVDFNMGV